MKTGIYVPLITPFKENGEVDYEVLARATKFVLAKGADGIYACGGTSEFCLLTTEERKRCLEVIIANADGKEVIAHVGSQSTAESVELAKHAASVGANMLSAVAPYYFGYTFPQIKEYFRKIAHATELELMIYNAAQARDYSLAEMKELQKSSPAYYAYLFGEEEPSEALVAAYYGYSRENYMEQMKVDCQDAVKSAMIYYYLLRTYSVTLSDAEMTAAREKYTALYGEGVFDGVPEDVILEQFLRDKIAAGVVEYCKEKGLVSYQTPAN
jgi:hypothetical protein